MNRLRNYFASLVIRPNGRRMLLAALALFALSTIGLAQIQVTPFLTSVASQLVSAVTTEDAVLSIETWTGGDSTNNTWTDNDNWAGIGGAGVDDDLVFPQSAARKTNTNDFAVNTRFRSIAITGTDYVIGGNQIFLSHGISANATSGGGANPQFNPNIILDAPMQTFSNSGRVLHLNGVVNLNGNSLIVSGDGSIVFNGTINGAGALTIANSGAAVTAITGNAGAAGSTQIDSGTLNVISPGGLGSLSIQGGRLIGTGTIMTIGTSDNPHTIAPGLGGTTTGVLTSTAAVTLNPATTFEVNLNGPTVGTQYDRLSAQGNVDLANASLNVAVGFTPSIGDQFTIVQTTGTRVGQFAQGTSINAGGQIFSITYNPTNVVLTAQGSTLTWDGGGATNNWSEAANWNPNLAPQDGLDLVFPAGAPADSLNTTNNLAGLDLRSITISGGGYLFAGNNIVNLSNGITANVTTSTTIVFPIMLTQAQTFNNGTQQLNLGAVNLNGFGLTIDGTANLSLNGQISGPGGITKNGSGNLFITGAANNYSGVTQINSGQVIVGANLGLGASGDSNHTVVASGATLILTGSITLPEAITLNGSGFGQALEAGVCSPCSVAGPITLASNSIVNVTQPESTLNFGGVISGSFGITKIGLGAVTLANNTHTYTGTTTINAGTWIVNGVAMASPVNLTGGTLGGNNGTTGPINASGGTVAPGQSPGTLLSGGGSGIVNLGPISNLNIEIGGTAPGSQYDVLGVRGATSTSVNLGGANLAGSLINGFVPTIGAQFTILTAQFGGITGQFAQGTGPVTIGGHTFGITYNPSSVVLTAQTGQAVPVASIADSSVSEGNQMVFPVTLTTASSQPVIVRVNTTSGTATGDVDYNQISSFFDIVIAAGQTTGSLSIATFEDTQVEPNEVFNVNILSVTNGTVTDPLAIGTILNDDGVASRRFVDFDGDGKTDISIFRPGPGEWWYQRSSDGQIPAAQFGQSTDRITPGDFTGDGKTDIAFWRPSTGFWFILRSEDGSFSSFPFGTNGDIPAPADYDGDGKTDAGIFRPSNTTWFIPRSGDGGTTIVQFGIAGDKPVVGDYDGDGKADIAIFRPGPGEWWYLRSSDGSNGAVQFGTSTDKLVQGDYTGDGKTDIAFWRPSTGFWFILRSEDSSFFSFPFGTTGDVPALGDYDGDGKFDAGVFRPSSSTWFVQRSTAGTLIQQFGITGDAPVPSAFIP